MQIQITISTSLESSVCRNEYNKSKMFHCQTTPPITYTKVSSCSDPSARVPSCRDLDPVGFLLRTLRSWDLRVFNVVGENGVFCIAETVHPLVKWCFLMFICWWSEVKLVHPSPSWVGGMGWGSTLRFIPFSSHRIDGKWLIYRHRWLILYGKLDGKYSIPGSSWIPSDIRLARCSVFSC